MRYIVGVLFFSLSWSIAWASYGDELEPFSAVQTKAYGKVMEAVAAQGELDNRMAQNISQLRAFFGRADLRVNSGYRFLNDGDKRCKVTADATLRDDALQYILEASAGKRLLLLNESHHELSPRRFLFESLGKFWDSGYRHIGFETLQKSVSSVAELDASEKIPGFYLRDPVFAGILRKALSLGFKIFHYEADTEADETLDIDASINHRETQQAENIATYQESVPPEEKILIWAGFQHISKAWASAGGEVAWMAARLENVHGVPTYAVDLTMCRFESAAWQPARLYEVGADKILLSPKADRWVVDAQLHLPVPRKLTAGYYRSVLGQAVAVPEKLRSRNHTIFVQAFKEGQPETALPYDNILLFEGEKLPLYLPAGKFNIIAYGANGAKFDSQMLTVRPN